MKGLWENTAGGGYWLFPSALGLVDEEARLAVSPDFDGAAPGYSFSVTVTMPSPSVNTLLRALSIGNATPDRCMMLVRPLYRWTKTGMKGVSAPSTP